MGNGFNQWIDRFIEEKGIDKEMILKAEGASGVNYIPLEAVIETMKGTSETEQDYIRNQIIWLDFENKPIVPFFEHLAKAVAV